MEQLTNTDIVRNRLRHTEQEAAYANIPIAAWAGLPPDAQRCLLEAAERRKVIAKAKEVRARNKALKVAPAPATNTPMYLDKEVVLKQDAEARAAAKKESQRLWRQKSKEQINSYQNAWRTEKKAAQVAQVP